MTMDKYVDLTHINTRMIKDATGIDLIVNTNGDNN